MTPPELAAMCQERLDAGRDHLALDIPDHPPHGERARLVPGPGRCPMGEVLNWREPGRVLALFEVLDVLAWLFAGGHVQVVAVVGPEGGGGRRGE